MSKRKTVLIVDDSPSLVDGLASALEDAGYAVGSARDGEEVFRQMAALEPHAILLDVYIPKLDGAEVCRLVKAHPHWKNTYLVLMSARIAEHELEPYRHLGADEILRKPVNASAVVELIRRAIGPPG